jgi:hypothetical protein
MSTGVLYQDITARGVKLSTHDLVWSLRICLLGVDRETLMYFYRGIGNEMLEERSGQNLKGYMERRRSVGRPRGRWIDAVPRMIGIC